MPDAVDTVVCAPDDGWWYFPKHVEEFPYKINSETLHLVGYILEHFESFCSRNMFMDCLTITMLQLFASITNNNYVKL
jgi:hypothetical protein